MPDEIHSIKNLIDSETGTSVLIVGTHRPGTGTGHLFFGTSAFTEASAGFGIEPFAMLAWHPLLDDATWIYVSDDTQSRRINVTGTDVKVGIPRPNRHGTLSEYAHIITPTVGVAQITTIYDLATGDDLTAQADWFSNDVDYDITGSSDTITTQKLSRATTGGLLNVVTLHLIPIAVDATTKIATAGLIFPSTLDLEIDMVASSRVESFFKMSHPESINYVRVAFSMEVVKTGFTYAENLDLGTSEVEITGGDLIGHGYSTGDFVLLTGATENGADVNGQFSIIVIDEDTIHLSNSVWAATPTGGSIVNMSKNAYFNDITPAAFAAGTQVNEDLLTKEQQEASDTDRLRIEYEAWLQALRTGHPDYGENRYQLYLQWGEAGFKNWVENIRGNGQDNFSGGGNTLGPTFDPVRATSDEWFQYSRPKAAFNRSGTDPTLNWDTITAMTISTQYNDTANGGGTLLGDRVSFAEFDMVKAESQLNSVAGGLPYDWRYTYYESLTGVESNPSPRMPEGIDVINQPITITLTGIDTTVADKIRLYRRGGLLQDWHLLDTIANPGVTTTTYVDGKPDLDIFGNQFLSLDNYPPMPLPVQVTQLLSFSERFSNAAWVKTNATVRPNVHGSPRFSETADSVTDDGAGGGGISQIVADPGKTTYFSIYVKAKNITGSGPHISLNNNVDAAVPITLAQPNFRPREGGATGVWERFVMTCSTGITQVELTVTGADDSVYVWGAQLDDWDATAGFLAPARHAPDLHDITALENRDILTRPNRNIPDEFIPVIQGSASIDDTTNVFTEILEDGGPPQVWWGPYQGNTIFGIRGHKDGELVDSGSLYWCKPGQPDHWSPFDRLPITQAGEPLQNGFLFNTHSYVFSTEHLYRIDPDPTGRAQFVSWPTPVGRGLLFPWAFAVGPKIWFYASGGIYETAGGPARSITAGSLIRPLFEGQTINGIAGVDIFADNDEIRMEFRGNYLYFMFKDLVGNRAVLRWHHVFERWEYFTYLDPVRMAYAKEGQDASLLYGTNNGFITRSGGANDDHGTAIGGSFRTGALDQGQRAKQKVYGDIHIEANIPVGITVVVQPFLDDEETAESTQNLVGTGARVRYKITMGKDKVARSLSLNFSGIESAATACAIHEIDIAYQIGQENELLWDSYFEDDGTLEDKWITGLYLECDTDGVDKDIAVFVDGVEITSEGSPFTINTADMRPAKISFSSPVRGSHMRFTSVDVAAKLRDWRWLWESQPVVLTDPFSWDNLGSNHEKYVKGFSIDADTLGQAVTLELRLNGDESTNALGTDVFTFTHSGRQQSQFAFDDSGANQVLAEVVRLAQTSSNPLQVFNLSWIFDTEPPHKNRWNTQERSFNLPGWGHLRDAYFVIRSVADVTLTVTIDGNVQPGITLANTSSVRSKLYVQFPAFKGKVFQFTLTSASDFKVYNEDTNIWVKPWNSSIGYTQFQLPFEGGTANP